MSRREKLKRVDEHRQEALQYIKLAEDADYDAGYASLAAAHASLAVFYEATLHGGQ